MFSEAKRSCLLLVTLLIVGGHACSRADRDFTKPDSRTGGDNGDGDGGDDGNDGNGGDDGTLTGTGGISGSGASDSGSTGGTADEPDPPCSEEDVRCKPDTQTPQVCDEDGEWKSKTACTFACIDGSCGGVCSPDTGRCDASSGRPQTCSDLGEWKNAAACGSDRACSAGECLCVAELTECSGACVDLDDSAEHCGACDHSCLGGECKAGVCQPFELATDQPEMGVLVVDDTHVYWRVPGSGGSVRRVPKNGGPVEVIASNMDGNVYVANAPISVAGGHLYWSSRTHIQRSKVDGTGVIDFEPRGNTVDRIVERDGILYWSERAPAVTILGKSVSSVASATPYVTDADASQNFTAAGGCIYYITQGAQKYLRRSCPGETMVPLDSGTSIGVTGNHSTDDTTLFYNTEAGVSRQLLAGPSAPSSVTKGTGIINVIVDDSFVYYIQGSANGAPACTANWSLLRVGKLGGGTPTVLIPAPTSCPRLLTMDRDALYWSYLDTNIIMKMAKPLP